MSVASLFHHVDRRKKLLCNNILALMFPFCNIFSLSRYFHWMETPQFDWKVIEGPLKANKFLAKVVHVHMKLENSASE